MAKSTLQAIAAVIADRYELKSSDATAFVAAFFDQIREGLAQDKQVKVRGLGTFKLQPVKARESVNVNTGERLVINGHDKMAFTPDNAMKELVNRPFADFETVMIKDGVNIDAIPTPAESATDEDGNECTTETTPTETESESSGENHQPATEERPPVVDEGHTNRDEPQPVVKKYFPPKRKHSWPKRIINLQQIRTLALQKRICLMMKRSRLGPTMRSRRLIKNRAKERMNNLRS